MRQAIKKLVINMINMTVHMPEWAKRVIKRAPWLRSTFNKIIKALVPDELTVVDLMGEDMRGYRLQIKLCSEKSMITGDYGPSVDPVLNRVISEGMTVYDVGAHIGYFSLWFARRTGVNGKVIAFEPDPRTLEQLRTNIELNNAKTVTIVEAAASNRNGKAKLKWGSITFDSRVVRDEAERGDVDAQLIRIDDFIKTGQKAPNVIKIDVEGHELEVLQGAAETLAASKPIIHCELHGIEQGRSVCEFLDELHYNYLVIDGDKLRAIQPSEYEMDWAHVVAWPEDSPINLMS